MGMAQKFLWHLANSECFTKPIDFLCYGGAQENIGKEDIGNILIAFPPAEEQRAIAAFLDRKTAEIDALVTKIHGAIDRLKEYRTALISAAATGKIDIRDLI
jgi:restriction endonuclease S subunit